jgi:hypothetical protein
MVDPTFAAAFIDSTDSLVWSGDKIFGKKLRKFSLWHRVLLRTIESPLVTGKMIMLKDLRTAVGICSQGYGNTRINKPWLIPFLIYTWATLRMILWPFRQGETYRQSALRKYAMRFVEYTGDYLQEPEYAIHSPESKAKKPEVPRGRPPSELETIWDVIRHTGWSEQYVWNLPIGKVNWYRAMALKVDGCDLDFTDDKQRDFQKTLPPEFRHKKN